MSRAVIFNALKNDAELQGFWPTGIPVWGSSSADSPGRKNPFIIISFRGRTKAFGGTGAEDVAIWAHLPKEIGRDYTLIDAIIKRVNDIMLSFVDVVGSDGWALSGASWLGTSADLFDDGYNSWTKNTTFRVASRYVSFVALG
jgi:hypothetical protein